MAGQNQLGKYEFIDVTAIGAAAIATSFSNQVIYCNHAGAPITARIVAAVGELIASDRQGVLLDRIRHWPGAPMGDALPLRIVGGLHALHLSGEAAELSAIYRGKAADDVALVALAIAAHEQRLLPWLDGPPQTNEAGRSANFVAAMLWLADRGLPPRFECREIGSSAGINLMMDRYRYDLGGVKVGLEPSAIAFEPEWEGPPPPDRRFEIISLKGCDVAPVDLTDPAQAMRLKAYIWPEHHIRFARMDAAIVAATSQAPNLVKMNAADFVEAELAKPQAEGTTRVMMHSIVWQYVPIDQQQRVTAAIEAAGARATEQRALAWIAVEANRNTHRHELIVRYWPGGSEPTLLAVSHPHGASIAWQA